MSKNEISQFLLYHRSRGLPWLSSSACSITKGARHITAADPLPSDVLMSQASCSLPLSLPLSIALPHRTRCRCKSACAMLHAFCPATSVRSSPSLTPGIRRERCRARTPSLAGFHMTYPPPISQRSSPHHACILPLGISCLINIASFMH